jgi:hypothetical protein
VYLESHSTKLETLPLNSFTYPCKQVCFARHSPCSKQDTPQYLLVVTYAVVELFLHVMERLQTAVYLSFLFLVSVSTGVPLCCVLFLADVQKVCSQLLQLTAGDADQGGVQSVEAEKGAGKCSSSP